MKRYFTILLLAFTILLALSCSCTKRMGRLRQQCPECFADIHDTITKEIAIPGDTLTLVIHDATNVDTTTAQGTHVILRHDTINNTVTLYVATPADTIHDTTFVNVTAPIAAPQQNTTRVVAFIIVMSLILTSIILAIIKHSQK